MGSVASDTMDISGLLRGSVAGGLATMIMLPLEAYVYRRHGLRGVFEWHEVQASLFGFQSLRSFGFVGFAVHAAFGGVAGAAVILAVQFLTLPPLPTAVLVGFVMWLLTVLLHERVAAVHPWRNDMGLGPVAASLGSHVAYGVVLGYLLVHLP